MRTGAGIAGIIGAGLLGLTSAAQAYTSPYGSMAAAGTFNSWATAPNMTLVADNTWVGTQTLSSASGEFKFTANNAWANSWGGNASIARVPAAASAPAPGGANLKFAGLTTGAYRFTFNDSTLEFRLEWAGGAPLPMPSITNLYVVGTYNEWTTNAASRLTNSPANTNLWTGSITLETPTSFKFRPNGNADAEWGAPEDVGLSVPVANASACGKSAFALTFEPGIFLFALNTSNATFDIIQTATQSFALSTLTVQGNFIATNKPPANMTKISESLWESDHNITNSGTITLRFASTNSVQYWGATNGTPVFPLPAAGALYATRTNYFRISGVTAGRYRITFNHQTGAFTFRQLYTEASGINLLKNPGFEQTTQGANGGDAVDWGGWQAWPWSVARDGVAPHSGSWLGAIHGKFDSSRTDYASFAQDVLVTSGRNYRASAWFKATPDWTADSMQIKIEWQNILGVPVGYDEVVNILSLGSNWVRYAVEGVAPNGASKAHVVFQAAGTGETGTMHIDDAEMRAVASRTQGFETWGALTNDFAEFSPDWSVTRGMVMWNVSPGRPPGDVFISQYVEGTGKNKAIEIYNGTRSNVDLSTGYVLRQYNNGATAPSTNMALSGSLQPGTCLVVARPSFPTNYAPDLSISGLPGVWTNKGLSFNGDDVVVLLGPGGVVKDRVGQVGTNAVSSIWSRGVRDHTLVRKPTIYTGTINAVTSSFSTADGWDALPKDSFDGLGVHVMSFNDPNEPYTPAGYSLIMDSGATLMSGELAGGIGDVSFWYRTESMSPPLTLAIETAASDSGPWTNVATLSDVAASNFAYYVASVNRSDQTYVRFRQTDGGTNRFRIDEIAASVYSSIKRSEDFNAWTGPDYETAGIYSRYGWEINASIATGGLFGSRAAFLAPPNGKVLSPTYADGVGEVLFWARADETNNPAYLLLQTSVDGGSNWITRGAFTAYASNTYSTWLYLTNSARARIVFDTNFSSGDVFIDNVEVHAPVLFRNQNFDSWPTRTSYTNESRQGWAITNCIVSSENAYEGNSARLRTNTGSLVQSPYFPDGLGAISFKAAQYNTNSATVQVQLSANGSSWTTLDTITPTSTTYESYTYFMQDTTNRLVRFYHSEGKASAMLDDISIAAIQPRPQILVSPGLSPEAPATTDIMQVTAKIITLYKASVVSVTGVYSLASTTPVSVPMVPVSGSPGSYITAVSIPPQAANTRVRYSVRVQYAGIGAASNSTGYTTNLYISGTTTNYVSSIRKGNVWINEIAYLSMDPDLQTEHAEYVELCGVAGSDIGNWTIRLQFGAPAAIATNGGPTYATYQIPPGTVLADQTNGYGFYVLGDKQLLDAGKPVDQVLTTLVPAPPLLFNYGSNHIHNSRGVIMLLNEYTNKVYALSYAGYASGADNIPAQQVNLETNSVGLAGTGSTYPQFTPWTVTSNLTIGAANDGQTLVQAGTEVAVVWHVPGVLVTPQNSNVPAFYMRDPAHAQSKSNLFIAFGYPKTNYTLPVGTLHHRKTGQAWSEAAMSPLSESLDAASNAYVRGTIPLRTYSRGSSIEYVIEASAGSGTVTTFIGADPTNDFALFETLAEATNSPFLYTYEVHPEIVITNMATNSTSWVLYTAGNEPPSLEPFTSFKIYASSNLLSTGYGYTTGFVATNVWTNNPIWVTNAFTNSAVDDFGQNVFVIPKSSTRARFYRIHALW